MKKIWLAVLYTMWSGSGFAADTLNVYFLDINGLQNLVPVYERVDSFCENHPDIKKKIEECLLLQVPISGDTWKGIYETLNGDKDPIVCIAQKSAKKFLKRIAKSIRYLEANQEELIKCLYTQYQEQGKKCDYIKNNFLILQNDLVIIETLLNAYLHFEK